MVVEIASNDGYLLQHFVALNVPVLGIEPAANVAEIARRRGVPTDVMFFGEANARRLANRGLQADLMAANNVFAHVPDILDFAKGFAVLLKPEAIATFEFPHLLNLIDKVQFDTIYHEHYSYLSLVAVERILAAAGLRAFDVEELPTHGGSLRLYVCHAAASHRASTRLDAIRTRERAAHLDSLQGYAGFSPKVEAVRADFMAFLANARADGAKVAAYGAAAKGNTFLNYCGITDADIVCVFDRSTAKQGQLLPGSHLPVLAPERIAEIKPDYLVVLPWNLIDEIKIDYGRHHRMGRALRHRRAKPPGSRSMKIIATALAGVFELDLEAIADERGFFARAYCTDELQKAGIAFTSTQINISRNTARHTLRGMHFQAGPLC